MDSRWFASFILILAFGVLGLSTALIGPALPDLAYATGSNIQQYTSVFFGRAIGFLIGVLLSGKIVDRQSLKITYHSFPVSKMFDS